MGTSLGAFGAALKDLEQDQVDDFTFMGGRYEIRHRVSPWLVMKFSAVSTGTISEEEGMAVMVQLFSAALGPEQFGSFDRAAAGCDLDDLIRLAMAIFQAQAGRPTEEPAGSSPSLSSVSSTSSSGPSPQLLPSLPESGGEADPVTPARLEQALRRPLSTAERVALMRPVADLLTG